MKNKFFTFLLAVVLTCFYCSPVYGVNASATNIVNPYQAISYSQMMEYLKRLEKQFEDLIEMEIIGKSLDNRDIVLVKLGKGDTLIHINGSMHARERITTNIILKNIEDYCNAYRNNSSISGYNVKELLDQVTIYYVPMVNPDGVDYTISGKASIRDPLLKSNIDSIYHSPQTGWNHTSNRWKANIRGVDLNRQWNSGWNKNLKYDPGKPADAYYKGPEPLSEPEAQAIYQLSIENPFMIHVAYHTQGKIFYWYKNQTGTLYEQSLNISKKIANLTGFKAYPSLNYKGYFESYAGYTDWTIEELKKPGFTMEFATNPYSEKNFDEIYKPAKALGLLFAREALNLKSVYNTEVYINQKLTQVFENDANASAFITKYVTKDSDIKIIKNGEVLYAYEPYSPEKLLIMANDFANLIYNYDYRNNNEDWPALLAQYIPDTGFSMNHVILTSEELNDMRKEEKLQITGSFRSDIHSITKGDSNIYTIKGQVDYRYLSDDSEDSLSKNIMISIYIDNHSKAQIISLIEENIE